MMKHVPPPLTNKDGLDQTKAWTPPQEPMTSGELPKRLHKFSFWGLLGRLFILLISLGFAGSVVAGVGLVGLIWLYGQDLPNHRQLQDYQPSIATRIYAGDGSLMGEFAQEKRIFVPYNAIPKPVVNGFIAAEDQNFFHHIGIDLIAVARAMVTNVINISRGRKMIGASTITQQVAKNFLLTNEVSFSRKIKEAILAVRIERAISKDKILELYLNQIYLGRGTYGVAAASLTYFGKAMDDLDNAEIAYLASLPKAPSNYDPKKNPEGALERRNWVLSRMKEEGFISEADRVTSSAEPLINYGKNSIGKESTVVADFYVEDVRRDLFDRYGESGLYRGGYTVRTSLSPKLQRIAYNALQQGLIDYDRRHGYSGPLAHIESEKLVNAGKNWLPLVKGVANPPANTNTEWLRAIVLSLHGDYAIIGVADGNGGEITLADNLWARERKLDEDNNERFGPPLTDVADFLAVGDVILVSPLLDGANGKQQTKHYPLWQLEQIPDINGSILAMDPHNGRVLAMSGGYSFEASQYNRATQALRQPGSVIKPFVYLAGLERGLTPSTIILDAPIVIDQGPGLGKWRPGNFEDEYRGPSPMRIGLEQSRNLMTIRLAQSVGMEAVSSLIERFKIMPHAPRQLSLAIGAGEAKLVDVVTAYAALVNGGKKVTPSLIDRVQDRNGVTVYRHDERLCQQCEVTDWAVGMDVPKLSDNREILANPINAYQIVHMLEGVVQVGTGRTIGELGRPLAGKTGTTNELKDTWFVGFSPDLAVGVYVGYDNPRSLARKANGGQETGGTVAAPIFKAFMKEALANTPIIPFRTPPGVLMVKIDAETGRVPSAGSKRVIDEAFMPGTEPRRGKQDTVVIEGHSISDDSNSDSPTSNQNNSVGELY